MGGPHTRKLWLRASKRKGWARGFRPRIEDGETDTEPRVWGPPYRLTFKHPEFECSVKSQGDFVEWQIFWTRSDARPSPPVTLQLISGLADTPEQAQLFVESVLPSLVYAMEQSRRMSTDDSFTVEL